jgi:hypothetical protein
LTISIQKITSGDTSRPRRLAWGDVQLPIDITLKGITCRYSNLVNKVLFKVSLFNSHTSYIPPRNEPLKMASED